MNVHDQDMYTISAGCTKAALLEQDININELNQANGGKSKITHRRQSQTLLSCELEAHRGPCRQPESLQTELFSE
jgi:hypothetical protein